MSESNETKKHRPAALPADRFSMQEFVHRNYIAVIPEHMSLSDVLEPSFWAHMAGGLQQWDRIEVVAEDRRYWGEVVVLHATNTGAHVAWLHKPIDLDPMASVPHVAEIQLDGVKVAWKGPLEQFCIIRDGDNRVLRSRIPTRSAAILDAESYTTPRVKAV